MDLPPIIKQLDQALTGWPDYALTALLFVVSLFGMLIAIFGNRVLKAVVAAWFIAP